MSQIYDAPRSTPSSKKPRLHLSFSGGRTSAFMSIWAKQHLAETHDLRFVFANTGAEHEDTLRFANEVDIRYGLGLVWVEAVVHPGQKKSSTHRVVTYKTASRMGEPFDAACQKYGLPNQVFKFCTRELKVNPINSFIRTSGWAKGTYKTAIGIRSDETRRVSKTADAQDILYPLVDLIPTDKQDVLEFFENFDWDLRIPEHQGNCVTCFKKSDRKLNTLYRENPRNFDFAIRLDSLYKNVGPNVVPGPRQMFRGHRSAPDLVAEFIRNDADVSASVLDGGCSESCELFDMAG